MKRKFKILIVISIVGIALIETSCKKIDVPNPDLQNLFGEWEWIETKHGESFRVLNPESEGYEKTLIITEKGIYKLFKNNKRIEKNRFKIEKNTANMFVQEYQITFYESVNFNKNNDINPLLIEFKGKDTLILVEQAFDGGGYVYVRQK